MNVDTLLKSLLENGWVVTQGSLDQLERALHAHGMQRARTQRGSARQTLRPVSTADATPNTMSAKYGLGAQPLHTDGAHLRVPPDVVVLYSPKKNDTSTRIWASGHRASGVSWRLGRSEAARAGLFTVRNGRDSFLAPAATWERLRVDPTCMSPADGYAREAALAFQQVDAVEVNWEHPDQILLIDNRNSLHARSAVTSGDLDRVLDRRTFNWGGNS
jgi:hypothetical protein